MALSPLDIKNKTFSTKLRGFNPDEVDDFLDQVITDYEESIRQRRDLEKSLKHAEEKLTYFDELKDALNQSIIVAQDTADKLKENASQESNIIISTANSEATDLLTKAKNEADEKINTATNTANRILKDAVDKATQLATETDDLKKKTRSFHRKLSMILESHLEIVNSSEWEEILKPFSDYVDDSHQTVKEVLESTIDNSTDDVDALNESGVETVEKEAETDKKATTSEKTENKKKEDIEVTAQVTKVRFPKDEKSKK